MDYEGGERVIRVARRVFVGNLSWRTSWQDLKDHFGQVGRVVYADVLREGGGRDSRSKGCGIVEFETPEEAASAITDLHDSELEGRKIWVREDREDRELKEAGGGGGGPRGGRDGGGGGYGGGPDRYRSRSPLRRPYGGGGGGGLSIGRRLRVENLSYDTTWQELKDHFKAAGRVAHADILAGPDGASKGSGVVEMDSAADALKAISLLSNTMLDGRQIVVSVEEGGGGGGGRSRSPPRGRGSDRYAERGGGGYSDRGPPRGGGSHAAPGTQICLYGLPYSMAWQEVKDLCRPAATPVHADIVTGPDGRSKGWATVAFATPSDADAALQYLNDGIELEGRPVSAKIDRFNN